MNPKKSFEETDTPRILVIGISAYGAGLINRLQKYQDSVEEEFGCTFITITDEYDAESIPKTLYEKNNLILIVAKEDQFSIKEITKVLRALNGDNQVIVGFLNGFLQCNFGAKLTNRVNLTENSEDAYRALRLLPDILSLQTMISIDFDDLQTVVSRTKFFNVAVEEVRNMVYPSDVDLSHSESIIFCVYGDEKLDMETIDEAALQICNRADGDSTLLYASNPIEPRFTQPRIVMLY